MADKDDELLTEAQERFRLSSEAWQEVRAEAENDLRMKSGDQWPDDVREQRERDGRPALTFNRLHGFIDQTMGDFRANRPSIRVKPVKDSSEDTAEVIEGLFRHIERVSDAEAAYDSAYESALSCSFGYYRVSVDYVDANSFEQDILLKRIHNPMTVQIDPYAKEQSRADMRYCFVTEVVPDDIYEATYPGATKSDLNAYLTNEDREYWLTENGVRVAEYWKREPIKRTMLLLSDGTQVWEDEIEADEERLQAVIAQGIYIVGEREVDSFKVTQYIINGAEILEETEWPGAYIPIVAVTGMEDWVDGELKIRSLIRFAKDGQRMYNYWRTSEAEVVALQPKAPYLLTDKQVDGYEDMWENVNSQQFPYLLYNSDPAAPGAPQRQQPPQMAAGMMAASNACIEEMKAATGLYDVSMGESGPQEESGRAILAKQHKGDQSTFPFRDNFVRSMEYAGKVILDLIPYVYSEQRTLKIMDFEGNEQTITINQKQVDPYTGMTFILNDITKGQYDIEVDTGPSFATQRIEAAANMMDFATMLAGAFPQAVPAITDLIAKNMDWAGADELAERMAKLVPPEINDSIPPAIKQQIQQMQGQLQQAQGTIQALAGELQKEKIKATDKSAANEIDAYEAETGRMKTLNDAAKDQAMLKAAIMETFAEMQTTSPDISRRQPIQGDFYRD